MNDSRMVSIAQLKEFLKVSAAIHFQATNRKETYVWLNETLHKFQYTRLKKRKDKSLVKQYVVKVTGWSEAHVKRLLARKQNRKFVGLARAWGKRHSFPSVYTPEDIALLAETDNLHHALAGPATVTIFGRMYELYGDARYIRLKDISPAHVYNLRDTRQYRSKAMVLTKTQAVQRNIGIRKKPNPQGKPGFLRVDTVHQGDLDKVKGVYHINLVDEVTQWELVGCVEGISEQFLKPLLEELLAQFPFVITGFHSDNGSEYINRAVARLLNKLLIEQTKSRSRKTNDNALVEGKNGSVIRKHLGYSHIPTRYASLINQWYHTYFNTYLNFHRPCAYATITLDEKGRQKKVYKLENYMPPYQKFKSLENPAQYLAPGWTIQRLDDIALGQSDNGFAKSMQEAKIKLFKQFHQ